MTINNNEGILKINHVLVDYENVPVASLDRLRADHFRVTVFLGPNNTRLPREFALSMQGLGQRATYVTLETPGRNALDFHLAFQLGRLAEADRTAFFHIISGDTGFDPLIRHLKSQGILSARSESIEAMPCFIKAAVVPKAAAVMASSPTEELESAVSIALNDLLKRGDKLPRKRAALANTVRGAIAAKVRDVDPEHVIDALLARKVISQEDGEFSYRLLAAP